jgi:hypothetical protein
VVGLRVVSGFLLGEIGQDGHEIRVIAAICVTSFTCSLVSLKIN